MSAPLIPFVRERLVHLTDTLNQLKDRVREAVAGEMGRIVSETVRDVLTAILRPDPHDEPRSRVEYRSSNDPDDWEEDRSYRMADSPQREVIRKTPFAAAVSVGLLVWRWLWQRRFPLWPCLGAGAIAGVATYHGGPVVHASLSAVASAADLVQLTDLNRS